ncbi:MAG: serine hydrolase [Cyclobacteriaceae bacterium]
MRRKVLLVFAVLMSFASTYAQDKKKQWVDSIFQTLSIEEKVGQLFVIPVSSYFPENDIADLLDEIADHHPGGLVVTGGGPVGTVNLIKVLQQNSRLPLLVMASAERGAGGLLDSVIQMPPPLAMGAIKNDSVVLETGKEIARQLKILGIHLNLAPNADHDLLPGRPDLYLGDNKRDVAAKATLLSKAFQSQGLLASAVHSTPVPINSSEATLPSIDLVNLQLDTSSFSPYYKLINSGVDGLLTSNLHFSVLDKRKQVPASVSRLFVSDILKSQLHFSGLTIANIPQLQEAAGKSKGETDRLAFEIGNDMLIDPHNLGGAIKKIVSSLKKNKNLQIQLDESVRRVLAAKYDAGLSRYQSLSNDNVVARINSAEAKALEYKVASNSITITNNLDEIIPISNLEGLKTASVAIGSGNIDEFVDYLNKYTSVTDLRAVNDEQVSFYKEDLESQDLIIVSLFDLKGINRSEVANRINEINSSKKVIVVSFGNPFDLRDLSLPEGSLVCYSDVSPTPSVAAQVIFGGRKAEGSLPLTINNWMHRGLGNVNSVTNRFSYGTPAQVGMSETTLGKIENIVRQAIDSGATPGCNILIARNGQVVYHKNFGWKTYDRIDSTSEETIYDLASITKVAATLQTVMFMYDRNLIDINKKVSVYLPELKNSNKKDFTIKDILTHQAGLWPYLPFWQQTMKDSTLLPEYYDREESERFPFPVSKDLFSASTMKDSLWHWIISARIKEKKPKTPFEYTYSDMGFYIMQHLAEKLLNQPIEDFLQQNFYEPLGAYTTGFLPFQRFPETQIAPTEVDMQFRKSKLVGYVHDQGAAMHGGIAGHAGLFSNANDLAKLGQMWLQQGSYGGQQYLKPETVALFTHKQYETSRRGLGWDKPTVSDWNGPTSLFASPKTFGHTGFTGTAIWVDPEFNLVFVFLSNRVYPDMFNTKLLTGNIRPRIQDVIYQSIFDYCKSGK